MSSSNPTRKVLFLAHNFPPHGGPGVQRSTKFVKYLPEFGWRPVVISAAVDATAVRDESLLADVALETPIFRVPAFSVDRLREEWSRFGLGRLAVGLNLLFQVPDAALFWARKVFRLAETIIEQEDPSLIYSTSGPYSAHLAGYWIRKQYGLPWFADFRDPWSKNLLIPYLPGYRWLNRQMERQILAAANRVACVSEPWLRDLQRNLGREAEKFVVLPNGYDDEDLTVLPPSSSEGAFTITHIGSFYRNRRPDDFIAAIRELVEGSRIPLERLRVLFIGKNARRFVPEEAPFEAMDYVPYQELDEYRMQSDAFLLLLGTSQENKGNYSGKIYEYIASNRPVLAIVPPGGVAEQLIVDSRTGIAVGDSVEQIARAIEEMYHNWDRGNPEWNPDWDLIRRFSRRALTEKLAQNFDEMLSNG